MGWSYEAAVARIRERIGSLPDEGSVLVASEGDGDLVDGAPRTVWHFPRTPEGFHDGLPADSAAAIAHLEELRRQGAGWLVIPSTSFRWLDHYRELHRHLVERFRCITAPEDDCLLFRLTPAEPKTARGEAPAAMVPAVGEPGLVSVVVPCYNQRRFLAEAIESVLAQTYPNVEIVFVDDGSTDRPYEEVVRRYPGIRSVWQENQGLAAARNRGLREVRGAYVAFLDADDRLRDNALSTGLQLHYQRLDHAFVAGHYCVIDVDGAFKRQWERDPLGDDPYEALLRKNCIGMHGAVLYRRGVFDAVGEFDVTLSACEDYDHYLRIARVLPVSRHEEVVAEYREHATNMSNDPQRMLETVVTVLSRQREAVRGQPRLEAALRAGISRYRRQYGRVIADEGAAQLSRALHGLRLLARHYPAGYVALARRLADRPWGGHRRGKAN